MDAACTNYKQVFAKLHCALWCVNLFEVNLQDMLLGNQICFGVGSFHTEGGVRFVCSTKFARMTRMVCMHLTFDGMVIRNVINKIANLARLCVTTLAQLEHHVQYYWTVTYSSF